MVLHVGKVTGTGVVDLTAAGEERLAFDIKGRDAVVILDKRNT
jgi:hypothetical protein